MPGKVHVFAAGGFDGASPFAGTARRLEAHDAWTVHRWETRHNVLHDGPARVRDLLLDL